MVGKYSLVKEHVFIHRKKGNYILEDLEYKLKSLDLIFMGGI